MIDKNPQKVKNLPITEQEKIDLEYRIFDSIRQHKSRKRRNGYLIGAAASVVLIICAGFLFYNSSPKAPSILDFVNTTDRVESKSNKVVLMLGGDENLKIDEEITTIAYSNTGQDVTIGTTKTVNQEVAENRSPVYNTLMVPYGKRSKIQLSDGSLVWLNSGSRMVYPAVFNGDKREVYIEGEAIFEVTHKKSQPFVVISQDQEIEVLGTVFGVTNYLDEQSINTVLKSGSVQISYHNNSTSSAQTDKMKISPGTKASYNKKTKSIVSEKVNVDTYFSWREGFLVFKNHNLEFIMKRISRYYNVEIKIGEEALTSETFSGYLDLNEDIEKVIESIKQSTNMDYELTENEIIIN
ncbi:MAG: FecR domain-containing protein [Flavobacteriaceae bacterium]